MICEKPPVIKGAWLRHARQYLNLYGVPLANLDSLHPNGRDLWEQLQSHKYRLIVDNQVPWEKKAKDKTFADVAFILGTTSLNERDQLATLHEDRRGHRKLFENVFLFEADISEVTEQGYILKGHLSLSRLDDDAISTTDKTKDTPASERAKEEPENELERLAVVRQRGPDTLANEIKIKLPHCYKNYRLCIEVSRMCLAMLLEREPSARHTLCRKGSVNSYSDAGLIKDALFLNAWVWSEDSLARKMATYCGVRALPELDSSVLAHY
jgi:hypothetical protein